MTQAPQQSDMVRERDETGRFVQTITRGGIRALFDEVDGPVIGTGDVAERFDCTNQAAINALDAMVADGELGKRKVGRSAVYWEVSGDG